VRYLEIAQAMAMDILLNLLRSITKILTQNPLFLPNNAIVPTKHLLFSFNKRQEIIPIVLDFFIVLHQVGSLKPQNPHSEARRLFYEAALVSMFHTVPSWEIEIAAFSVRRKIPL